MVQLNDTPQQKMALRQNKIARKVREKFPPGSRVVVTRGDGGAWRGSMEGTIKRHVPGMNAQGGHFVVVWDNGSTGRYSAVALAKVADH